MIYWLNGGIQMLEAGPDIQHTNQMKNKHGIRTTYSELQNREIMELDKFKIKISRRQIM